MRAKAASPSHFSEIDFGEVFHVSAPARTPSLLIVCEHASNRIPDDLDNLGLSDRVVQSHVAWDPGALHVAQSLARRLPAVLVSGAVSRLVYDCNRPPEAASAIPERSETFDIIGNGDLSPSDRNLRIEGVFAPFSRAVDEQIARYRDTLNAMVTIHSFTPVYFGSPRQVELGILHGQDERLALSMMRRQPDGQTYDIRLNEPYSARDGVTYTLDAHGPDNGLLNVMIEIRNDLIRTTEAQEKMAAFLAPWIEAALKDLSPRGGAA